MSARFIPDDQPQEHERRQHIQQTYPVNHWWNGNPHIFAVYRYQEVPYPWFAGKHVRAGDYCTVGIDT